MMKPGIKILLRNWLAHFAVISVVMIISTLIPYFFNYRYNSYGNTDFVSPFIIQCQYFLEIFFHGHALLLIPLLLLLIEINRHYLFKKIRLEFYIGTCLLLGAVFYVPVSYLNDELEWRLFIDRAPEVVCVALYALAYSFLRNFWNKIYYQKDTGFLREIKKKFKLVVRDWLIHFGIFWTMLVLFTVWVYKQNVGYYGYHQFNADKSPITVWQYFLNHILHGYDIWLTLIVLFLMEVNYRYIFKKINLTLYACCCLLIGLISLLLIHYYNYKNEETLNRYHIIMSMPVAFYVALYALVYALTRDYWYTIRHKKELQLQQSKNELNALKSQLNPHFLFNSLNYLYGTALNENAPNTADGIDKLSAMMRHTITGVHENYVPVKAELSFIKSYLELQRARIADKETIDIQTTIEHPAEALLIAPMLLLPFIENAFKYGLSLDEHCYIHLNISFTGDNISLNINNSIKQNTMTVKGNNTGIKNTVKRLDLLYPGKYELKHSVIGNAYKVTLTVKLTS